MNDGKGKFMTIAGVAVVLGVSGKTVRRTIARLNSQLLDNDQLGKTTIQGSHGSPTIMLPEWEVALIKEELKRSHRYGKNYKEKDVYVISNRLFPGEYKVGVAHNTKKRLDTYQIADPNRGYVLEYTHRTADFLRIENYIHNKYPNKSEWVRGDLRQIIDDIKSGVGVPA